MGYKDNIVQGGVPHSGAIFTSNIGTKKECFRQKLFGLPSAMSNFVLHVKKGMILFLFEFERRQLYGVFRATSDGDINIVPTAFKSSGRLFPAQVCVSIWPRRLNFMVDSIIYNVKKAELIVVYLIVLHDSFKYQDFKQWITLPLCDCKVTCSSLSQIVERLGTKCFLFSHCKDNGSCCTCVALLIICTILKAN